MNATPPSPKDSYGPRTAGSSSADSPNPQPHNAQAELSRQPLRQIGPTPGAAMRAVALTPGGCWLYLTEDGRPGIAVQEDGRQPASLPVAVRLAQVTIRRWMSVII